MFEIQTHDIVAFFAAFFGGGGLGWVAVKLFIKNEAKAALEKDLEDLKDEDEHLHNRINHVENTFVPCKYCDMQHSNLGRTLDSMDKKLDILIEKKTGGK